MSINLLPRNVQFIFKDDFFNNQLSAKTLIVSKKVINNPNCQIKPEQVNQFLGQELDNLYYDAIMQFDVNQFAAIVGCLRGGGSLILRLPNFYKKVIHSIVNKEELEFQIPIHNIHSQLLLRFVLRVVKAQQANKYQCGVIPKDNSEQFNIEQERLIIKIERCALGHAKRPLVITADRGRGKSTALAKASASLCYKHNKKIIITAPRKENLNIFFEQFNKELEYLSRSSESLKNTNDIHDAKKRIDFIPIDKLLQTTVDHHFLIVDEAGSLPVQVLNKVILKYNRIAFASTVSGYEGNGRGFEIKFIPLLSKAYPQYRTEKLSIPYRWQSNDLLEDCCNKAFLLAQPSQALYSEEKLETPISSIKYQYVNKENLLQNEALLTNIFSLLTEAHYQTRPSDLERILSDPQLRVYVGIGEDKQVVSASLIVVEGLIENSDCVKISQGKLRIDGQLLPQSLISTKGIISAGELTYWRIMRIAVVPSLQNSLIGSNMIKHILEQSKNQNIDILGTSFALSTSLFNFWNSLDFHCCRIALRTDSSTGLVPADFLLAITNAGISCSEKAIKRFNQSFVFSSSSSYRELDSKLLSNIMSKQIASQIEPIKLQIVEYNKEEILNYINKARSFEMVEWEIANLIQYFLITNNEKSNLTENFDMLFAKVFQKYSWTNLTKTFNLKGKKEAIEIIRYKIDAIYQMLNY